MALKSSIECLTVHYKLGTRPRAFISSTRTPHESVAANADLISTSTSDVDAHKSTEVHSAKRTIPGKPPDKHK